jgi:hypothetical protein
MTHEELETKVYDKMSSEYDMLLENIKQMPPQDIIDNAYQIVFKQDILSTMDNHFLGETQLRLLLEAETPLDDLYQEWLQEDCAYLEDIEQSITDYLDGKLKTMATEKYCKPDSLIYMKGICDARDDGELHEWKASNEQNIQCKLHFTDGVERAYNIGELPAFVQAWAEKFGLDRCLYVTAYTVKKKDYDHRFDAAVRKRSAAIVFADGVQDSTISNYSMNIDIGTVNAAMTELMKLEKERHRDDTFSIYQLKDDPKLRDYRYEPLNTLLKNGFAVEAGNYNNVYTAPLDVSETLGTIYFRFNNAHPADFKGHSLSISDVVVLRRTGKETARYVDSIGFAELSEFTTSEAMELTPPKKKNAPER